MNEELLIRLSNADAVASKESEVRDILKEEMCASSDEVMYDKIGSTIFHQRGTQEDGVKVMFCAHMDEVGFLVRHISEIGFLYLVTLGGVLDKAKENQRVRVTTAAGQKVYGILNVTKTDKGAVKEMYVDLGVDSKEEVAALGVEIGDMVTFDSHCTPFNRPEVYAGKAMDDRTGCYVICEALKRLKTLEHQADIYMAATSSEEVGVRGGKLATYRVNPDIVFAVDVANNPELVKNYANHRLIGHGPMIVHYDRMLAPNEKLLRFVKETAKKHQIPYQADMFGGGGTDAGSAHLSREGKLALVIGIPLRYCHAPWSLTHMADLEHTIELIVRIATSLTKEKYQEFISF
ncbi:Putative aminopeptidase FrvX [Granulicatella balaenopterae]|uniref:Putative aminopeptidase FrvX n=1 Tax=Granulicatella balaenopterae TaxID=137733 RepID=A0A1H9LZ91_9LACT|nr:aminopeptidase [Granulicatella balaenopterae]SER16113.1 Putative aminopeptidase FrvX [Granulicatella balaenopterae]